MTRSAKRYEPVVATLVTTHRTLEHPQLRRMPVVLYAVLQVEVRVEPLHVEVAPNVGGVHLLVGPVALQPSQMLRVTVPEPVCVAVENVTVEPPVVVTQRTSRLPAFAGNAHVPTDRG